MAPFGSTMYDTAIAKVQTLALDRISTASDYRSALVSALPTVPPSEKYGNCNLLLGVLKVNFN